MKVKQLGIINLLKILTTPNDF